VEAVTLARENRRIVNVSFIINKNFLKDWVIPIRFDSFFINLHVFNDYYTLNFVLIETVDMWGISAVFFNLLSLHILFHGEDSAG